MIVQIEAPNIADLLDRDERLVPDVADLLIDALIKYRDAQQASYTASAQTTTQTGFSSLTSNSLNAELAGFIEA